jgi:hypothetical protein
MSSCNLDIALETLPANMATGTTVVVVEPIFIEDIDLAFWVASFAEERFASLGEQPLNDTRIYVSYDPLDVLPGATQADRTGVDRRVSGPDPMRRGGRRGGKGRIGQG